MLQDIDITLELSGKHLRLLEASNNRVLISQRLHSVRQWSAGTGANRSSLCLPISPLKFHLYKFRHFFLQQR